MQVTWFRSLTNTGSVVSHIALLSPQARLAEDGQRYRVITGELGGTEPAADLVVMMVLQRKQLSTANRAIDPIQLHSIFRRIISLNE